MTIKWFEQARGFADWQNERRELRCTVTTLGQENDRLRISAGRQTERMAQLVEQNRRVGLHRIQLLAELATAQKKNEALEGEIANLRGALTMVETALGFHAT